MKRLPTIPFCSRPLPILVSVVGLVALLGAPVFADDIYICVTDNAFEDATTANLPSGTAFEKCSVATALGENMFIPTSGGGAPTPLFRDLRVIKPLDLNTTAWRSKFVLGGSIATVYVHVFKEGSVEQEILEMELSTVKVRSIAGASGEGGTVLETLSLMPHKVKWTTYEYNNAGSQTGSSEFEWDIQGGGASR